MTGMVLARDTLEFKQEAVRLVRGGQTVSSGLCCIISPVAQVALPEGFIKRQDEKAG